MGFGLRGALTNLLALSEFIMSLLTYQKVFVLCLILDVVWLKTLWISAPRGLTGGAQTPSPFLSPRLRPQLLPSCFPATSCPAAPRKKISTTWTSRRTSISSRSSRELRRRPLSSTSCGRRQRPGRPRMLRSLARTGRFWRLSKICLELRIMVMVQVSAIFWKLSKVCVELRVMVMVRVKVFFESH